MFNQYFSRITDLSSRARNHGLHELLDREQSRDDTAVNLAVLDALIVTISARRNALPM